MERREEEEEGDAQQPQQRRQPQKRRGDGRHSMCRKGAAAATSKSCSLKPALHRRCWTPFRQAETTSNGLYRSLLQTVTGVLRH
jgi:hypothetical protein